MIERGLDTVRENEMVGMRWLELMFGIGIGGVGEGLGKGGGGCGKKEGQGRGWEWGGGVSFFGVGIIDLKKEMGSYIFYDHTSFLPQILPPLPTPL